MQSAVANAIERDLETYRLGQLTLLCVINTSDREAHRRSVEVINAIPSVLPSGVEAQLLAFNPDVGSFDIDGLPLDDAVQVARAKETVGPARIARAR